MLRQTIKNQKPLTNTNKNSDYDIYFSGKRNNKIILQVLKLLHYKFLIMQVTQFKLCQVVIKK